MWKAVFSTTRTHTHTRTHTRTPPPLHLIDCEGWAGFRRKTLSHGGRLGLMDEAPPRLTCSTALHHSCRLVGLVMTTSIHCRVLHTAISSSLVVCIASGEGHSSGILQTSPNCCNHFSSSPVSFKRSAAFLHMPHRVTQGHLRSVSCGRPSASCHLVV